MPDPLPAERLQPCLLDRLIDENPESQKEGRSERVMSQRRYRESALRDLRWLLNARSHVAGKELEEFAEVFRSVLNFGTRDLCGKISTSLDIAAVERELVEAIEQFEPRIIKNTLTVKAVTSAEGKFGPSTIAFEIDGELWADPIPEELYIRTEIDLETGQCSL